MQGKVHIKRVQAELRQVGMTGYGALKFASRYLPTVLRDDEHVQAAVYGRYRAGAGLLGWTEGMLVATERRLLFLDHKPGYTATDELTYDTVSGVQKTTAGPFSALTLHTRIGNYTIRFANTACIDVFMKYVEERRLAVKPWESGSTAPAEAAIESEALDFLRTRDIGVLSTVDRSGGVHGAAVYYAIEDGALYMITKGGTQKAHDTLAHHQVAFTVFDAQTAQTVQLQGVAEIVADQERKDRIFAQIVTPHPYASGTQLPPVAALHEGAYIIFAVRPTNIRFTDYAKRNQATLAK
ncbi:MAG TPA: pyridoxamine 5'-phosphate oxidase family protein [Candidatus Saccharimonadales bacterium]|nr:pyridoxamine 5'-phosphate oxidase family protein [Candidatus Saccharimonadales bacterium]